MKIQRAFKVRLYTASEQRVCLNKTLGSCRFLYNLMLAERIAIYQTLKDNAELKNITISISPTGKYYASCLFEEEQDYQVRQEKTEKVIGLDMSLRDFYVDNLGNTPEYRRVYRKSVDMAALALGSKGETAVETPAMGKSRNLEEQASQETQASSPCLRHGAADGVFQ